MEQDQKTLATLRKLIWVRGGLLILTYLFLLFNIISLGEASVVNFGWFFGGLGISLFFLVKLYQLKNWARRLGIVFFILLSFWIAPVAIFSGSPNFLYPQENLFLNIIQRSVDLTDFLFSLWLTFYLFRPHVRAWYISTPPKTYQRVLLIIAAVLFFLFGLGILFATRFVQSLYVVEGEAIKLTDRGNQILDKVNGPTLDKVRKDIGVELPNWGFWMLHAPGEGFYAVTNTDFLSQHLSLLFFVDPTKDLSIEEMLQQWDAVIEEGLGDTVSGALQKGGGRWMDMLPEVTGPITLNLAQGPITGERVLFPRHPDFSDGILTSVKKGQWNVMVLVYTSRGMTLKLERVEEFLSEFLAESTLRLKERPSGS